MDLTNLKERRINAIIGSNNLPLEYIMFEEGYIEMGIVGNLFYAESRNYRDLGHCIRKEHELKEGYNPLKVLKDTEKDIINRVNAINSYARYNPKVNAEGEYRGVLNNWISRYLENERQINARKREKSEANLDKAASDKIEKSMAGAH